MCGTLYLPNCGEDCRGRKIRLLLVLGKGWGAIIEAKVYCSDVGAKKVIITYCGNSVYTYDIEEKFGKRKYVLLGEAKNLEDCISHLSQVKWYMKDICSLVSEVFRDYFS